LQKLQKKKHYKPHVFLKKPYNFFGDYLWKKYGSRVLKLPIDAGFTCPNKDGSAGTSGCIFCAEDGSASPTARLSQDIIEQMENAKKSFRRSEADTKYIAYFQAFTNTYSSIENLKSLYDKAVSVKDVTGLMIATRPDCLPYKILDIISGYNRDGFELHLEIGMQSIHDNSLAYLNRGHTYKDTKDAVLRAHERGISVCLHVILGIPGESWNDMMETAKEISLLPVSGVKIHHLHVIKGTKLEEYYNEGMAAVLTFKEYISVICDFLERLRPDIMIHRLIGDKNVNMLIAPKWALHKGTVLKAIEDEFIRRCTYQGFLWKEF
jgi:uncharacterized protein